MQANTKQKVDQQLEWIEGNVCAPKGFLASGVHAGFKRKRKDLALIYSQQLCSTASVYTQNKVKGAPLIVTQEHSANGYAQAIICNSGNANTCNANGIEVAHQVCALLGESLDISNDDVIVASTGVIGQPLDIEPFKYGIPELVDQLNETGDRSAAEAILTTDTNIKESAVAFEIEDTLVKIGGMSKGSGMIHPNMATMLGFVTTDAAIEPEILSTALKSIVKDTFNMISVDGDTSTNDMVTVLANAKAGNAIIDSVEHPGYATFKEALHQVCKELAIAIAKDGEGASTLITCNVLEASTEQDAKLIAKEVISSSLVKTAVHGRDANVGRLLCAIGYSGADFDQQSMDIYLRAENYQSICVCEAGSILLFDEDKAFEILGTDQLSIDIYLYRGQEKATAWGCDLTYDYVKINSAYRT
ncbi:bifunctional glutamate N-acetyltransferase/amino-acid acetyltransferase ArgJ [Marinilactibacillus sp. Marseille-P9653]|uniref:bifunctional glutamate N-acetyltransferase/amino-acid acetyltransferase ArgJ n=1 Tax=Marinilactibacillus sp. Marseille-P9653 TaxID=2866583 RepID=UPI001CE459BE|nr:bifunctional glutamate N-acetyltransferase/amino-acid acetyltransferase ArgJ [Marinilactibacillus sp. Marseille-P9653]